MPFPCSSCQAVAVNGINTHETGCPDAWRDRERQCTECGGGFVPQTKEQTCCDDNCHATYNGLPQDDEEDDDFDDHAMSKNLDEILTSMSDSGSAVESTLSDIVRDSISADDLEEDGGRKMAITTLECMVLAAESALNAIKKGN